jgi:hypothetical protein
VEKNAIKAIIAKSSKKSSPIKSKPLYRSLPSPHPPPQPHSTPLTAFHPYNNAFADMVSPLSLICFLVCLIAIAYAVPLQELATKQYVLAMQRCKGSSTWTLHGLWPQYGVNCKNQAEFDEKSIAPFRDEMETYYLSCPEFGKTNLGFWDHEWSKHGTCYAQRWNQTQAQYFLKALDLREELSKLCDPKLIGECRLGLDEQLRPL